MRRAGRGAGFNEAGAVMPRKGRRDWPPSGRCAGFNEAGAVMPRKGSLIEAQAPDAPELQ